MPVDQTKANLSNPSNRVRLVVASSVMLTFISFWRAAAIVLNDLGSSAFYAGGIAEQAVGKAAPWFILGVMLFSFAVRAVYVESCTLFTRGGVYRVVKGAIGGNLAKLSVSAVVVVTAALSFKGAVLDSILLARRPRATVPRPRPRSAARRRRRWSWPRACFPT